MQIENVKFGGLNLQPDKAFIEDGFFYTFNFKFTYENYDEFEDFVMSIKLSDEYFKVSLKDKDNMFLAKFGLIVFSKHDEFYKVRISFIDKKSANTKKVKLYLHTEHERVQSVINIEQKIMFDNSIETMKSKGVLSVEKEKLNVSKEEYIMNPFNLIRIEDVDDIKNL